MLQKLPIGQSDFKAIIEENRLYVDKTEQVYNIINGSKPNFLSRPRRFGKSLLVSIMKHIFNGNKELFRNLWIYDKIDWKPRPVIQLSLVGVDYRNHNLEEGLCNYLDKTAQSQHGLQLKRETSKEKFGEWIDLLSINEKIVILIDEYDKPIIDFIDAIEKAEENREVLKGLYGVLKEEVMESKIHFLFITGISKFAKTSIFSELNNLDDLTLDTTAAKICGITQKELEFYFASYIEAVAERLGTTQKILLRELKRWYNGYSWNGVNFVYNPFSLLNFFKKGEFANFWFASGTPTLLLRFIKRQKIKIGQIEKLKVSSRSFNKFTIRNLDFHQLLFQTGYLTIKRKTLKIGRPTYTLGYPNQEVEESFLQNLIEYQSHQVDTIVDVALLHIEEALQTNNLVQFIEQLKILFSDIAHQLHPKINKKKPTEQDKTNLFKAWEGYFHSIIYLIIKFLGLSIHVEMSKFKGRIDAVIEVDNYLYIMEFKLDANPQKAIEQIKNQQYFEAFKNTSKQMILVGISFSSKEYNVKEWQQEILN